MGWGYLLILLGSILFCVMTAVRKEYQREVTATLKTALLFVLINSLFLCAIGLVYFFVTNFTLVTKINGVVFGLGLLFAFILVVNTSLCIFGAKHGSLAILTVFATLGTLVISTLFGLIVNPTENKLSVFNVIGLIISTVIISLSFIANKKGEEDNAVKSSKAFIFICLAVFLFNGSALSVYSAFTSTSAQYGTFNFIFLYSFFCVIICLIALLILFITSKKRGESFEVKKCITKKPLFYAIIYGAMFCCSEFLSITTTTVLPIIVQAPLIFAINVIIVAIADYVIYKQKLTKMQLIQIALALASGICFAI